MPDRPEDVGQWAGPWSLEYEINPELAPGDGAYHDARDWGEIAHLVVLPRTNNDGKVKVLFACRRQDGPFDGDDGGDVPSVSFLFDPSDPTSVETHVVNSLPGPTGYGARDLFCGAQTLTADGDVVWVGGTDVLAEANDSGDAPWGHPGTHVFINDPLAPHWTDDPALPVPVQAPDMGNARWYPSIIQRGLEHVVGGHRGFPQVSPKAAFTRESASVAGGLVTWQTPGAVLQNDRHIGCVTQTGLLDLGEYPHLHALARGDYVLWTGHELGGVPTDALLDDSACQPQPERWVRRSPPPGSFVPQNAGLNSVHIVDLRPDPIVEAVYTIGGGPSDNPEPGISAQVLKLSVPQGGSMDGVAWSDSPGDLNQPVIDGNTVILLDGSLLRVGGYNLNGTQIVGRKAAESYKPIELFPGSNETWVEWAAQTDDRWYHSTAALLPDGRVLSGGGRHPNIIDPVTPSWYSFEMFSPKYMFLGPRPRVMAYPSAQITYGSTFPLDVVLRTTSIEGKFKVALLSPSSCTHGVEFSQRYIVLDPGDNISPNGSPKAPTSLPAVEAPETPDQAPPGWYMLTVVNSEGIPAEARWVQVGEP